MNPTTTDTKTYIPNVEESLPSQHLLHKTASIFTSTSELWGLEISNEVLQEQIPVLSEKTILPQSSVRTISAVNEMRPRGLDNDGEESPYSLESLPCAFRSESALSGES